MPHPARPDRALARPDRKAPASQGRGRQAPFPGRFDGKIERQIEASVSDRLAAAALARRHKRRNCSEQALRDAGIPLDQADWAR
jgi:macrodomain Ter protein organizer (MatP/YcbG family)